MLKIGILKETKEPSDARVVITPKLCKEVMEAGFDLVIQRSNVRLIKDEAYSAVGALLVDDVSDCDILIGVKEVKEELLIEDKTYFFFSHTHKEQAYNRSLLKAILNKRIRMIDYEVLKDKNGSRIIAFGKFAGMVGAHNALWTYNQRNPTFSLDRMNTYENYEKVKDDYRKLKLPNIKIVLTGTGKVGKGADLVLNDMGITKVDPSDFLLNEYDHAVYTQLNCIDYVARKDGGPYEKREFYNNPKEYKSIFLPYTKIADVMINGIFWDNEAPVFFNKNDMKDPLFRIRTIADVTCDIAPISSIPSTLYPTTIADPVFTYEVFKEKDFAGFTVKGIDMMTIDNLPNEMAFDASQEFGRTFVNRILPELKKEQSDILDGATLCKEGKLTDNFNYLKDFVNNA